jgi:hypothetical protein
MLPTLSRTLARSSASVARSATVVRANAVRAFADAAPDGGIPLDKDHQAGRRAMELSGTTFNRDPIWIDAGVGTKENPACVPSLFSQRTLGVDDPETQQLFWFNAKKGELTYVEAIDKYFTIVDAPNMGAGH